MLRYLLRYGFYVVELLDHVIVIPELFVKISARWLTITVSVYPTRSLPIHASPRLLLLQQAQPAAAAAAIAINPCCKPGCQSSSSSWTRFINSYLGGGVH